MATDLSRLACPECMEQVFAGVAAYLCDRCDTYQHKRCWNSAKRCIATEGCRGKPREVVVVRLEAPGPTADAIADRVEERLAGVIGPAFQKLSKGVAQQKDVERIKNALSNIADAVGAADSRVEELRAALDGGLREIRRIIEEAGEQTRVAEPMPAPGVSDDELRRIVQETSARADEAALEMRSSLEGLLSELSSTVRTELYRVQRAVDACRWDTGARRHPLPWDERPNEVFLQGSGRSDETGTNPE